MIKDSKVSNITKPEEKPKEKPKEINILNNFSIESDNSAYLELFKFINKKKGE